LTGFLFFIPLTLPSSTRGEGVETGMQYLKKPGMLWIPACAGMTTFYEFIKFVLANRRPAELVREKSESGHPVDPKFLQSKPHRPTVSRWEGIKASRKTRRSGSFPARPAAFPEISFLKRIKRLTSLSFSHKIFFYLDFLRERMIRYFGLIY
jgi:hypothetical protein